MSTVASGDYSDAEVEAIFRRALERQAEEGEGYGHEELVAAAREVGLSDDAVDKAVREIQAERSTEAVYAQLKKKQRERWLNHFVTYLIVVGGMLGLHALGYMGAAAIWVAFGWGMGLAMHTFNTVRGPTEEQVEKRQRKLERKARREAAARARREERQRKMAERAARKARQSNAEGELERVIEEGVTLLLGVAAKKLAEASRNASQPPRPQGEFQQYVADKKAGRPTGASQGPVVTPPPKKREQVRARVAVDEDEVEAELAELQRRQRRRRS